MTMRLSLLLITLASVSVLALPSMAQDQPIAAETPAASPVESEIAPTTPVAEEQPVAADPGTPDTESVPAEPTTEEGAAGAVADVAAEEEKVIPLPALNLESPIEKVIYEQLLLRKPPFDIEKMPSLFLTVWERDLISNARKGLTTRDPEAPADTSEPVPDASLNPLEGPRDLRLSGIIYRSSNDWVIWLNAKRISPTALPKEIMNIKVNKDYIELEWLDVNTNQIFPVRLRPHQRFNLDARVFLPG